MDENIKRLGQYSEPPLTLGQEVELGNIIQGISKAEKEGSELPVFPKPAWADERFSVPESLLRRYPPYPTNPRDQKAWAIARLCQANIKWFLKEFFKYSSQSNFRGFRKDELISAAACLPEAARTYNPEMRVKFSTHLYQWIHQGIQSYARTEIGPIVAPQYIYELEAQVKRAWYGLYREGVKRPTPEQLTEYINRNHKVKRSLNSVKRAIEFSLTRKRAISLDASFKTDKSGEGLTPIGELLNLSPYGDYGDRAPESLPQKHSSIEKSLTKAGCILNAPPEEKAEYIKFIFESLNEEERRLVQSAFGFTGADKRVKGRSLIAKELGKEGRTGENWVYSSLRRISRNLKAQLAEAQPYQPKVVSIKQYAIARLQEITEKKIELGRTKFLNNFRVPVDIFSDQEFVIRWEAYKSKMAEWQRDRFSKAVSDMKEPISMFKLLRSYKISAASLDADLRQEYDLKISQLLYPGAKIRRQKTSLLLTAQIEQMVQTNEVWSREEVARRAGCNSSLFCRHRECIDAYNDAVAKILHNGGHDLRRIKKSA